MVDDRDLGGLGEHQLQYWCSQVGLVPNKSFIDRTGWDYLVEFPANAENDKEIGNSLDLVPPSLECRIQVKSNDIYSGVGKSSIILSNIVRFVNAPIPCFFLFIEFCGDTVPNNAYLVHVDEPLIGKILRRLRKEEVTENLKTNKKTFDVSYTEEDKLAALNGAALKEKIIDNIGDFRKYCEKKINFIKSVGYEGKGQAITANFTSKIHPYELLVDFGIGLCDSIKLDKFVGENIRFGIPAAKPFIEGAGAELKQQVDREPSATGLIKIRKDDYDLPVELKSDVYHPGSIMRSIPEEFLKLRFSTVFCDFIVSPSDNQIRIIEKLFSNELRYNLADISSYFLFLEMIEDSYQQNKSFQMEFLVSGNVLGKQSYTPNTSHSINFEFIELLKSVRTISKALDVEGKVNISINTLLSIEQQIKVFKSLLGLENNDLTVTNPINTYDGNVVESRGVPLVQALWLGDIHVVLAVAAIGVPIIDEDLDTQKVKYEFISPDMQLIRKYVIENTEDIDPIEFKQKCENEVLEYLNSKQINVLQSLD